MTLDLVGFVFAQVPLANLPACLDGYSLAMISDIHAGPTVGKSEVRNDLSQCRASCANPEDSGYCRKARTPRQRLHRLGCWVNATHGQNVTKVGRVPFSSFSVLSS